MIDTNVSLFRWPFRRLPLDETAALVDRLREQGVQQAWAGSFDALLHRDVAGVNGRLADECRRVDAQLLRPFGCVNPTLPDWQEDLRRCIDEHQMPGMRLYPNYHGYGLDDDRVETLFSKASEAKTIVQIVVRMEDTRTQHPLVQVPDVDLTPLSGLLEAFPTLPVVLLNAQRTVRGELLETLVQHENVCFDIAMQEGVRGVAALIEQIPYERILYGSHAPFFVPESARLKLDESELGATIRTAIETGNAQRLLG